MKVKNENIERFMYAMYNFMQGAKRNMEECCKMCGNLSEKELIIVNYVGINHNVKMSDIAETLSAPLSTLTSIVDKLVERKYLERYHSNEDRRVVLVTLAKVGNDTFTKFINKKKELSKDILSGFNDKEQSDLIRFLEKIPSIMQEKS